MNGVNEVSQLVAKQLKSEHVISRLSVPMDQERAWFVDDDDVVILMKNGEKSHRVCAGTILGGYCLGRQME